MIRTILVFLTGICLASFVWFSYTRDEEMFPFGQNPFKSYVFPEEIRKNNDSEQYHHSTSMLSAYASVITEGNIQSAFALDPGKLQLYLCRDQSVVQVYLLNASDSLVKVMLQDGRLMMIREAQDEKGEWKPIEYWWESWCGNSYDYKEIKPGEGLAVYTYQYTGSLKTNTRFKLRFGKQAIYSPVYEGMVDPGQFDKKKLPARSFFEDK